MKIFYSEFAQNYSTYSFAYGVYAKREDGDTLDSIYERGFLPYTGRVDINYDLFYLARSLRVNLKENTETSENRRLAKVFSGIEMKASLTKIEDFDTEDKNFLAFCSRYARQRFKKGDMSPDRLRYVVSRGYASHIMTYHYEEKVVAYVLCCVGQNILHYWFAFFDTGWFEKGPIGKWIMYQTLLWAKNEKFGHIYLGTCYNVASLYKARDFKGIEFFDGMGWNASLKILQTGCKSDESSEVTDRVKFMPADEIHQKIQ